MKVTSKMIHPQLRKTGRILKVFARMDSEEKIRTMNRYSKLYFNCMRFKGMRSRKVSVLRKDNSELLTYILTPRRKMKDVKVPGILWLHGGGYALGSAKMVNMGFPKRLIRRHNCVIVAPEYRLSCERPYPAALEDAYAALKYMKEHAEELGIDSARIMVGGESAGGGLAAALCLYARDKREVRIAYQILLYPMLDDRGDSDSMKDNDAPVWNEAANIAAWKLYLGDVDKHAVPAYAAAGRCADLQGLPPAVLIVGTIEPFHDETVAYMTRLWACGVRAEMREFKGCFHAFDMFCPRSSVAKNATAYLLEKYSFAEKNYRTEQFF
ncbi:MAG: alpha/beta hydrolase [Lachnospiraceae bacterium]|nr:alpha/beta hydrolase [Lachnospiraceae bacterium]MDD3616377.1 alpha/beta hydrolase [Lachnospiraceae bacterium]